MARYQTFLKKLPEAGATVTELPTAEIEKWKATMPNIAGDWAAANADKGAPDLINAYMEKVKAAGITPKIDWQNR